MADLTEAQTETLLAIINFSNSSEGGGKAPTGPQLANIFGISPRAANLRFKSLLKKLPSVFKPDGRGWLIDYNQIATEPETGAFLLKVIDEHSAISKQQKKSQTDDSGRVPQPRLFEFIEARSVEDKELFLEALCNAEYLIKITGTHPKKYRLTAKLYGQRKYLELLRDKCRPSSINKQE